MKLKQISFKIVSMVMVIAMMFSICATTISAASANTGDEGQNTTSTEKDVITFVSIGDSMTNGYGLEGYDGNSGIVNYANNAYANKFAAWLAGYEGEITDDQVIFEGDKAIVDHRQLAMSGFRAEDLYWALTLDYENDEDSNDSKLLKEIYDRWYNVDGTGSDWNSKVHDLWFGDWGFTNGDYRTWSDLCDGDYRYADGAARILATYHNNPANAPYFQSSYATPEAVAAAVTGINNNAYFPANKADADSIGGYKYLQIVTEFFQKSVADADVIALALGNTNFGTFMLNALLDVVTEDDLTSFSNRYDIEDVYKLANLDAETEAMVRKLIDEYDVIVDEKLGALTGGDVAKSEAMRNIVIYCALSFVVSYIGSMETILKANPDVEIINIALMNMYDDREDTVEGICLGDIVEILYAPVNTFIASLPVVMQANGNELYKKATFYFAEADEVIPMAETFGNDYYTDADGNSVKYPGFLNGTEGYTPNNKSVVRERFVEEIVKGSFKGVVNYESLTVADITAYEILTPIQKMAYAATDANKAAAIAKYLAFENAIIRSCEGVYSIKEILGAFGADMGELFAAASNSYNNSIGEAGKAYAGYAYAVVAAGFESQLENIINDMLKDYGKTVDLTVTAAQVKAIVEAADDSAKDTAISVVAANAVNAIVNVMSDTYVAAVVSNVYPGIESLLSGMETSINNGFSSYGASVELDIAEYYAMFDSTSEWTGSDEQKIALVKYFYQDASAEAGFCQDRLASYVDSKLKAALGIYYETVGYTGSAVVSGAYTQNQSSLDAAKNGAATIITDTTIAAATEAYLDNMISEKAGVSVTAKAYIANEINGKVSTLTESVNSLCQLVATPQALSDAIINYTIEYGDIKEYHPLVCLLWLLGWVQLGTGIGVHPADEGGHSIIADAVIEAYQQDGIPASVVLEKFGTMYNFIEQLGVLGDVPQIEVVKEIYNYLTSNAAENGTKYITDEQTLDIILCAYNKVADKEVTEEEIKDVCAFVYTTLLRNKDLSDEDRVAIIGNIYAILNDNYALNEYKAIALVENIYTALDEAELISDEQAFAVVDYLYDVVIDGFVEEELLEVFVTVYNIIIKNEIPARRAARRTNAASDPMDDVQAALDAKSGAALRIILTELVESYDAEISEENKATLETLITGDDALVNDALLLELADSIVNVIEAEENKDLSAAELVTKAAKSATDTVLNSENASDADKMAIIGEITTAVDNNVNNIPNGGAGAAPELDLDILRKIYDNLAAEGLLTAEQAMDIIRYLYDLVASGEELSTEQMADAVAYVYSVVFENENLTVKDKIEIVAVVFNTLKGEGYIDKLVDKVEELYNYVKENYEEMYAAAYEALNNRGYIALLDSYLAIAEAEVEKYAEEVANLGVEAEYASLVAKLARELDNTAETIAAVRAILNSATHAEAVADLYALLEQLADHAETVLAICDDLAVIADERVSQVVAEIEKAVADLEKQVTDFAEELAEQAYEYFTEKHAKAQELYAEFVETVVSAIAVYSEVAAAKVEEILNAAPEKVHAFVAAHGMEILELLAKNTVEAVKTIAFLVENCSEQVLEFIINNAINAAENTKTIIAAMVEWVSTYGPVAYDFVKVYIEALDLNFRVNAEELGAELLESFNEIFAVIGQIVKMVEAGNIDVDAFYEGAKIIEGILAEVEEMVAEAIRITIEDLDYNKDVVIEALKKDLSEAIANLREELRNTVEALEEELANKVAEIQTKLEEELARLEEEAKAKIEAIKAELEESIIGLRAEIEILKEQLKNATEDAKAEIEAEIERLEKLLAEKEAELAEKIAAIKAEAEAKAAELKAAAEQKIAEIKATVEAQIAALKAEVERRIAELKAEVEAKIAQIKADTEAFKAEIETKIEEAIKALDEYIFERFSKVDVEIDKDSVYVAIGGADSVEDEDHYANLIAGYLGINAEILNDADLRISDLRAILDAAHENDAYGAAILAGVNKEAYLAAIAAADIISVNFGVEDFTTFAFAQILGYVYENYGDNLGALIGEYGLTLGEHKTYEMNWNGFGELVSAEEAASVMEFVYDLLAEQGVPTALEVTEGVTVDVAAIATYAIESYMYAFANYVYNYGATIEAIHAINPDAEIIVLGAVNPFDGFEIEVEGTVISVEAIAEMFARMMDVHTIAYAYSLPYAHYVYVGGAETVAESDGIIEPIDLITIMVDENGGSVLSFNASAFDATVNGHEYIKNQILRALDSKYIEDCKHVYDNSCDDTCNICGAVRKITHTYDGCPDTECNVCGFIREGSDHEYSGCTDATCYKCQHVREAFAHTYDGCLDAECNACGYKRLAAHTYAEVCSEKCLLCDYTRVTNHSFGNWTLTKEATRKAEGEEKRTCSVCGKIETRPVAFTGLGGGAIAGIVSGSTVIAGAGGFSVFWFVVKKKSFTDLVGVFKSLTKKGE